MKRTLKFSLNLANVHKIQALKDLSEEYKKAVNYYLQILSSTRQYILSEEEVKSFNSSLSYRYKQCANRHAIKIWKSWRRKKKKGNLPEFDGSLILDSRFIEMEKAKNSTFDYWVKISTLNKGKRILIPVQSYDYANQYFDSWKLVNGGRIKLENNKWFLLLTFEKETPSKKNKGKAMGVDIGIKKLIITSEGKVYGKEIEPLMDKIQRKEQGSKAFKKALKERDYYINRRLKKEFRSKFQRWTYPRLFSRVHQLCELNSVYFFTINPAFTSQTCNICGFVHKLNRKGEKFLCKNCGYTEDADFNASKNILKSYLAQQFMVAGSEKVSEVDICPLN